MTQKCERFIVFGVVQGVGFRYYTSRQGLESNVTGYAKNLNDGSVEVMVCGQSDNVEMFAKWLAHGPKSATVDSIIRSGPLDREEECNIKGFEIL